MGIMKTLTINGTTYEIASVVPKSSVTLLADRWVRDGDAYSQVVEVAGVTPRSKVDLQPTREQLEEFHHKVLAFVTENDNGEVKAYAIGDKPSGDHTMQVTLTEVEGSGKVRGNTVGTTMPRSNFYQTDSTKADYIIGREDILTKEELQGGKYVTFYGAKGDGKTDDTEAFEAALTAERVVFVPGGEYVLSGGLVIRGNCCLELSQDAVLNFTNTEGNCITLGMLSHLKGNHATVNVPYAFSGNVVYAYSADTLEAEQNAVPPFTKWDPQWKSGRYVSDLNICKADSRGFHYAVNPDDCKGTAVYLSASGTSGALTYMWGIHYTNIRIAGAFAYGIRAVNFNKGWLHEMRIDAFIDACEIGVSLEECANVYVSAIVQPRRAYSMDKVYKPYAKHGIQLIRSKNADLSGSRVWDWNATHTLWTEVGEYQHISMIGDCSGAIINDYMYHGYGDTRNRIYTDNKSNLDQITILQEPIDRWFKIRNGDPYYNDGDFDKKLVTQDTLDEHFTTDLVKHFTDILPEATDTDGTIFGGVGYKNAHINGSGVVGESAYYVTTGFIPLTAGHTLYVDGMTYSTYDGYCRFNLYDSDKNLIRTISAQSIVAGNNWHIGYTAIANGFSAVVNDVVDNNNVAYIRFSVYKRNVGGNPMVSIDEPIKYTVEGFLADGVKVKGENVIGNVGEVQPDWIATHTYNEGASVYDERDLIFENHNTAYLKDYGGGFRINIGIEYDVYWGGERYTCEAKTYDDTPYLGNGSLGLYGAENTGEPFCLYGSFTSADSIAYVKKDNTETETISLKVTTKGNAEYSKLPKEYLPDDIGGSIDVTAEVGQTIIVKEVDASGKPTKWDSAEYQPRTHWEKKIETPIFEANNFTVGSDGAYMLQNAFTLAVGTKYAVVWDGVEYTCEAESGTYNGIPMIYMGNPVIVGGEMNEFPFAIGILPKYGTNAIASLVPNSTHSCAIYAYSIHKIPERFAPDKNEFVINLTGSDSGLTVTETASEIKGAIESGKNLIAKWLYDIGSAGYCISTVRDYSVVTVIDNGLIAYAIRFAPTTSIPNGMIFVISIYVTPDADGNYTVSAETDSYSSE